MEISFSLSFISKHEDQKIRYLLSAPKQARKTSKHIILNTLKIKLWEKE